MDTVVRFLPGRPWWAESRPVSPSLPSKQQILRGFPSRGIPFPKESEDIQRCDVCPHPKPIRRAPLPGWLSYGTERRKEAAARKNAATANNDTNTTTTGVRRKKNGKKESKKTEEMDFFLRHDGHFKKPEKLRIVTFVKQYQRSDKDFQASRQSDQDMDYGPNCDMKLLGHPTCGVNCYQVRKNVYKAFDELMSKQPEVVRIKPRPKEVLEMRDKEATSPGSGNGKLEEVPNDRAFTTTEKMRLEKPNQNNHHEADADLERAGSNDTPSAASSLPMEVRAVPAAASLAPQAEADTAESQNGSQPPNIATLLFPQPVLAAVPDGQGQSSYKKEVMQNVRERQREKHWQRERLNSAIIYQELAAKAKTIRDEGLVRSSGGAGLSRTREKVKETDEKMIRGKAQSDPEEAVAQAKHGGQEFGGLQDLLKTAEEFERRDVDDHEWERQQQLPFSGRSISPTELEYMKAAILTHNFYPRLVSCFIDQHAAGAPAETVAKLEQVRSKVMQSWNPTNSVECSEKIKRYQEILTKFESELEKPFQEAMELSFSLENMFASPHQAQKGNGSRSHNMSKEEEMEGEDAMFS